ncbi:PLASMODESMATA CALLOSE-BINDING PROTEIN 3-like [Juglans microcarpa x Juglans regia]|uniref:PLASMODESMATA CALLOSE-BINDING PROTEIN 3-like n=1 Tax=Juglans microcarpa x Juglans regia TaxID=2249226 RepID=UPI001B7E0684|nr:PLASMODESMATA CALLOSE-BINDING PROTEIN 3-like [Juglans microcarpa x Juglans regia]
MAAPPHKAVSSLLLIIAIFAGIIENRYIFMAVEGAYWCVARSDASTQALQTALDYACGTGADCSPILSNGLCYLPNTIQAHASYAFNSYFQRKAMEPGSCDFSGTATIAQTDPSYGSCVYPSSASAAGGTTPTTQNPYNQNASITPTISGNGRTPGVTSGLTPPFPDSSKAFSESMIPMILVVPLSFLVVLTLNFQPI